MSLIYLTRHGIVGDNETLSSEGTRHLLNIRKELNRCGFNPKNIFSSIADRCIETAKILAPNMMICVVKELSVFEEFEGLRIIADDMLYSIFHELPKRDILISCHDSAASVLALRILEKRGNRIDWRSISEELMWLEQGHGILVKKDTYTYF